MQKNLDDLSKHGLYFDYFAGSVDALKFSAALRIFAEWRMVRQVPEGYKGYAVGMNLGRKDIIQNVGKIEQAVHAFISEQKDELGSMEASSTDVKSPTLRQLLQFEIDVKRSKFVSMATLGDQCLQFPVFPRDMTMKKQNTGMERTVCYQS